MDPRQTRNVLEACLLVAGRSLSIAQLETLFENDIDRPDRKAIRETLLALAESYEDRGIELVEVAGGWRLQTRSSMGHWVGRLFRERPPRYSRALLETLVLIAYRQPITRGEIEEVRGVAVSSNIVRTLQERQWVREVGHKDVPGRPALLGTTSEFLDYFNLRRLDELPPLGELKDVEGIEAVLAAELGIVDDAGEAANDDGTSASVEPDSESDVGGGEVVGGDDGERTGPLKEVTPDVVYDEGAGVDGDDGSGERAEPPGKADSVNAHSEEDPDIAHGEAVDSVDEGGERTRSLGETSLDETSPRRPEVADDRRTTIDGVSVVPGTVEARMPTSGRESIEARAVGSTLHAAPEACDDEDPPDGIP